MQGAVARFDQPRTCHAAPGWERGGDSNPVACRRDPRGRTCDVRAVRGSRAYRHTPTASLTWHRTDPGIEPDRRDRDIPSGTDHRCDGANDTTARAKLSRADFGKNYFWRARTGREDAKMVQAPRGEGGEKRAGTARWPEWTIRVGEGLYRYWIGAGREPAAFWAHGVGVGWGCAVRRRSAGGGWRGGAARGAGGQEAARPGRTWAGLRPSFARRREVGGLRTHGGSVFCWVSRVSAVWVATGCRDPPIG